MYDPCMDGDVHAPLEVLHDEEPVLDIEERLRAVCGHLNVLNAQLVELAAEALATGSWQGWGVKSLAHWLTWQAGISPHRAAEVVRLAEARTSHPAVMSTFAAGALSVDQAAMATKAPAYLDEEFAELATSATVAQLKDDGAGGPPGAADAVAVGARAGRSRSPAGSTTTAGSTSAASSMPTTAASSTPR